MTNGILKQIEIGLVRFSPTNTRYGKENNITPLEQGSLNELAENIKINGVIEPLIVIPADSGFELISGERRLRASNIAQLKFVPCIVKKKVSEDDVRAIQVAENLHREDLNPIDEAQAFREYFKTGEPDIEALAEATNKSREYILRRVRLAELSEPIKDLIAEGKLTASHGLELLRLSNNPQRLKLAKYAVKYRLSTTQMGKEITGDSWTQKMLKDALFDIKDEDAKPSCVGCAYHGLHQKEIFKEMGIDVDDSGVAVSNDQCFDSTCYDKKNWAIAKLITKRTDAKVVVEEGRTWNGYEWGDKKERFGKIVASYFTTDKTDKKHLKFVYENETGTILIRHEKKSLNSITVFTSDMPALKAEFPNFGLDSWDIQRKNEKARERAKKVKEASKQGADLQATERAEKEITRFKIYADMDRREFLIDRIGSAKPKMAGSKELVLLNSVRLALCQTIDSHLSSDADLIVAIGKYLPEPIDEKVIKEIEELKEKCYQSWEYSDKEIAGFERKLAKLPQLPKFSSNVGIWEFTEGMSRDTVTKILAVVMNAHLLGDADTPQHEYNSRKGYSTKMLEYVGDTLAIDRQADMTLSDTFIEAQTKGRLLQLGHEIGVFKDDSPSMIVEENYTKSAKKILKGKKSDVVEAVKEVATKGNSPLGYATGELDEESDTKLRTKYLEFVEKMSKL